MSRTYRSKHEADEFADSVKKKAKTLHEIQLKGYHIASLYCEVHEFKSALPYAESYVAVKPADPRGWKLVGFIYESLKNPSKAIESYRRSLELNDYQKELVLKVAELYCEINYEAEKHRFWAERAERYFPNHRIIHKIREHILRASKNLKEYERYLREKLRSNSKDIYLNTKLIDILLETSQMKEGFIHCSTVGDACLFESEPRWWQKVAVFYKTMISQQAGQADSVLVQVYSRLVLAVNTLVGLGLAKSSAPPSHNVLQIQALDKMLLQMSDFLPTVGSALQRPQGDAVVQEIKGQLFFNLATLYLKMAVVGSVSLSDVVEMAAACYLASLQVTPYHDISQLTLKKDKMDGLTLRLRRLGAARMSEVGHMLKGLVDQHGEEWLEACREKCCSRQGRQRLFEQLHGIQNPDPRQSFLMMDDAFILPSPVQLPDMVEAVFVYDKASIEGGTTQLQRLVWLGLQWDVRKDGILPDLGSLMEVTFERLALTTKRLDNTSVDNLCILDLEAFLYASVFIARTQLRNLHREGLANLNIPVALLVNCYSEEQLEWYMSVYQLYNGKAKPSDLGKLRLNAKKGMEVLRCQKNHGIETQLLIELGRTFNARAGELRRTTTDPNDRRERREAYQEMSILYWQAALEHLKMMAGNRAVLHPKKPMFSHVHKPIEDAEIAKLQDEGAVVIAQSLFEKGQHQVALTHLAKAKTPEALFAKAMMVHNLASMETEGVSLDRVTSDMLKRQGDLLDQSKHALYLTMDTIAMDSRNPLHEEVQTLLEEIEQEQASILEQVSSLETANRSSDISSLSTTSAVRQSFLADQSQSLRTPSRSNYDSFRQSMGGSGSQTSVHSQHAEQLSPDPSPRRLAAEVRALTLSHSHLLEQNQRLMQREDKLMESNAELMKQILQLTKDLQEVKLQQVKAGTGTVAAGAAGPGPAVPSTPPRPTQPTPSPVVAGQATPQSQQHQQLLAASRQTGSPSIQQPPSRALYQPHPAYHPLDSGAYYYPHMVPASPLPGAPGAQAWYPSPYGVPSPVPNTPYYQQQGFTYPPGVAAYDHEGAVHPGSVVASTPRSTGRSPLDSLYGMYSSIGASPEEKVAADQLAAMQGLKQQQQTPSPSVGYAPKQLVVSGSAGAALLQGATPQKPSVQEEERPILAPKAADKTMPMFKGGSITSGTPTKSPGVTSPAMFAPNSTSSAASTKTQGGAPDRGMENVTPLTTTPSQSSVVKPLFRADAGQGITTAKPQTTGFSASPAVPTGSVPKPSQNFSNFSFAAGSAVKPAASIGKPAITTAATTTSSPFAGLSLGITTTTASSSSSSAISSTGVFKPTVSAAAKTPSTFQGVFGGASQDASKDLSKDTKPMSSGNPGFYASPKVHPGTPEGGQPSPSTVATRKPGQSPLTKTPDAAQRSVTFKPEIDDDDVIFVSMTLPPKELVAKAKELLLPPGFYLYEKAPPCRGCRGCDEDLDVDSLYKKDSAPDKIASVPAVRPKETAAPAVFGSSAGSTLSFGSLAAKPSDGGLFAGGDSSGGISFASLANTASSFGEGFGKKETNKPFHFANAGAPVFGGSAKPHHDGDDDDHGHDDEYDPHYEPIISLPDIGTISTGEEGEDELFRHRAKLYRYDRDRKAWKERGVGDIKIHRNPKTGDARILMRRDQIFKLCANHWITKEMELKPMQSSETSWIWVAVDFAEEEAKDEQLCVKFKHAEDSRRFKEAFDKAQKMLGQKVEKKDSVSPSVTEANPQLTSLLVGNVQKPKPDSSATKTNPQLLGLLMGNDKNQEASTSIASRFAKKSGTWDCEACYTNNASESSTCVACSSAQPGSSKPVSAPAAPKSAPSSTSVGAAGGAIAARFAKKSGTWDCGDCYSNNSGDSLACVACGAAQPGAAPAPTSATTGASGGTDGLPAGAPFKMPSGFSLGQDGSTPSTGFRFGSGSGLSGLSFGSGTASGASGASGASISVPSGFNLAQMSNTGAANTTAKDGGAKSTVFKPPSNFGAPSSPSAASTSFPFGASKKDNAELKGETAIAPTTTSGATTPGGTQVTDKFTFSGMPQFSFADSGAPPTKGAEKTPAAGFTFGAAVIQPPVKPAVPQGGYSFSNAVKTLGKETPTASTSGESTKPSLSFADLAKSSTFSFRMDINEVTAKSPVKSPGGGRSPKTSFSRSPHGRTRTISTGTDGGDEEVEQGDDIYFEPVVQLADDYEVKTGEEGEEVKFSHRAKLFRFDSNSKQWKERGVGDIKILYNADEHAYRIVMRREQVFKVCANHYVTTSLALKPHGGSDRSWVWSAMDASDGIVQNEQLAVRFKMAETAGAFKMAVEKAKEDLEKNKSEKKTSNEAVAAAKIASAVSSSTESQTSVPEVKSCDPKISSAFAEILKAEALKPKPSTSTASTSHEGEEVNPEEERDIHFQPIVKLPDKVELVTGEEEETVVFVGRGKLYRFDVTGRQWKERGLGDIKIMHAEKTDKYRIVMRREQIHKVCANHYITATMTLNPMSSSDRAWVWHAMDSSDGEPSSEQLAIKFKDAAVAATFKEKFEAAQEKIRQNAAGDGEKTEGDAAVQAAPTSLSDNTTPTTAEGKDERKREVTEQEEEDEEEYEEDDDDDDDDDEDDDDDDDDEDDDEDYEDIDEEDEEEGNQDADDASNPISSLTNLIHDKVNGSEKSGTSTPTSETASTSSDVDENEDPEIGKIHAY